MTAEPRRVSSVRKWIRRVFYTWALVSTLWVCNSFRTKGVGDDVLANSADVEVVDGEVTLAFVPTAARDVGLAFFCGAGVAAEAYAPLLRPLAEAGFTVVIVKLPYRVAPLPSHKDDALARLAAVLATRADVGRWVVGGHSLGATLAVRAVDEAVAPFEALALVGTTHPKRHDLSRVTLPVTKIVATLDGVAPLAKVEANAALLPAHTRWVTVEGGNHAQFGHYGPQLLDGTPTISRADQQAVTRQALLELLERIDSSAAR